MSEVVLRQTETEGIYSSLGCRAEAQLRSGIAAQPQRLPLALVVLCPHLKQPWQRRMWLRAWRISMPFTASTWRPICSSTFCHEGEKARCHEPSSSTQVCLPGQREAKGSKANRLCVGLCCGKNWQLRTQKKAPRGDFCTVRVWDQPSWGLEPAPCEAALTCMEKSVVTQPTCTLAGTVSQCPVSCWTCFRLLGVIQPSLSSSLSSSSSSSSSAPSPSSEFWRSSVAAGLLEMLCVFCGDGRLVLCTPGSRDAGQ